MNKKIYTTKHVEYLELLKDILVIDSRTSNFNGVNKVGIILKRNIVPLGFRCSEYKNKHAGNLLVFMSKRFNNQRPTLLISGHTDTVLSPKDVHLHENAKWIHGSGANDMKGGLVAMVYGIELAIQRHGQLGNIIITLSPDEETGSQAHKSILEDYYKKSTYALVLEGKGDKNELCSSRRGIGLMQLTCVGRPGHSGMYANLYPNAIEEAAYQLNNIVKLAKPKEGLTVNTGRINGGEAVNMVADKCVVDMDIRFMTDDQYTQSVRKIGNIIKDKKFSDSKISFETNKVFPPMTENKRMEELKQIVAKSYKKLGGKLKYHHRNSASDANLISSLGVGALDGLGTYGKYIHTPKERVLKESIFKSGRILSEIIMTFQYRLD